MIGDDIQVTEDYYLSKIGQLVSTLDMAVRRIAAKDAALKSNEEELKVAKDTIGLLKAELEIALHPKKEKKV